MTQSSPWTDPILKHLWSASKDATFSPVLNPSVQNSLLACEFLLQNGANVNQADNHGRGPLHHATILGHTG